MSHSTQATPPPPAPSAAAKPPAAMSIRQRRAEVVDVLVQALLTKLFAALSPFERHRAFEVV